MKRIAIALLFGALALSAQTTTTPAAPATATTATAPLPPLPTHAIFAGIGLAPTAATGNAQHADGTAGYLQQVSTNLYMFARYDILGLNRKPIGLQTVVTAGACQILQQLGPVVLGACLDGGTAVAGSNIGGAIGADGLAGIRFGSKKNWGIVIQGGIMKTALGQAVNPIRLVAVYGF